MKTDILTW